MSRDGRTGKPRLPRPLVGALFLAAVALLTLAARPWLTQLLPAGNLAYLFRDGRYLVLLQNNAELRASGGFLGSYAEIKIENGRPGPIEFGTNIYKLDEPFTNEVTVPPPRPLQEVTLGKWAFRDSNWAADFPEAAEQMLWFYEREQALQGRQMRLDGVVALTTTVVEELLRLTGPVDMPAFATTLTADNFAEVVQYKIEKEYYENRANWPIDEPKTILKDLIPILEERVRSADPTALLTLAWRLLDEKYVVLFSKDPLAQRLIVDRNWGGAIDRTDGNYLYLVNSNVQGVKSSRKINERVRYSLDRATRRVTLYIEREHTGTRIWPDGENKNWVRVLVPKGSKLVSARFGIGEAINEVDIGEEAGKTVFGFWMNTRPQETQDATVVYEIPADISLSSLTVQRQPGSNPDELTVVMDRIERFSGSIKVDQPIDL